MDKQVEQEAAYKEKEREFEAQKWANLPENDPSLSTEDRKQAYLDRMLSDREEQSQSPEIDKGDRGRE